MEIINQPQSNWYTTEYISKNFKCTPDAISMCKSRHKNELIEGVHWRKAAVTSVTGAKYHDIWSKDGILKLAEFMKCTQEAQDFLFEIRFQEELKKRMVKLPDFNNPVEAARAWADECEAKTKALALIEEQKPKVEFADAVNKMDDTLMDLGEFAKIYSSNSNVPLGRTRLFELLREKGVFMGSVPKQKFVEAKMFVVKPVPVEALGELKSKAFLTVNGVKWLVGKLNQHFKK